MEIDLGYAPHGLDVKLIRGVDFSAQLSYGTATAPIDWPVGSALEIRSSLATWTATMDGPVATFSEPSSAVNALLDSEHRKARLWYTGPGQTPVMWAAGRFREVGL